MKKMKTTIAIALLAIMSLSACSDNKYKDRLDEIKNVYKLPAECKVIKELGTPMKSAEDRSSDMWCIFVLGGDTILYHSTDKGNSMCSVSNPTASETSMQSDSTYAE